LNEFGRPFDGSQTDVDQLLGAIIQGRIAATGQYVSNDNVLAPFSSDGSEKIIVNRNSASWFTSMILNGEVKQITQSNSDGSGNERFFDPRNAHPYDKLDIDTNTTGKITSAQITLDPTLLAAGFTVGQIFGSELGAALGGKDQLGKLAGSAAGGAIGSLIAQKFVSVLATSMTTDLSQVSLADVFASQGINIASAGIGAVSSFLTAELGSALKIPGFGGQLFNAAANGFTVSVLSQVTSRVNAGLSFDAAIGTIDWSAAVSGVLDVTKLNLDGILGGYLAHEFVPAKTHEGAVGGALLGAIGNLILPGGLGSFIGNLLGTLIFNHFGTSPSPGAVDLLDQAGYFYNYREYQSSDHGTYDYPDKMAPAADAIINVYLQAVHGAALDHSKQVTLGYIVNPDLLFITGVPGNTTRSFTNADDAVHAAALDVLQNTEVIGGDLLMKRAHHNSPSNDPAKAPGGSAGLPGQAQFSAAEQLVTMASDLSVAQDYENYLNNREAINAVMAANPDTAFTAGWIATFARVADLKLNLYTTNDFLGGLVGYLDSVNKAGLGAAASASVSHGGFQDSIITIAIKLPNGAEVPGSLSVFADATTISSDATGQTVQLQFGGRLAAGGFRWLDPSVALGDNVNDLWFGGAGGATFHGTAGHDILVGGAGIDTIYGGDGWDFIDGGAGDDMLLGEAGNDILHGGIGNDNLQGGQGNDAYVFNRGDGADTVYDDYEPVEQTGGSFLHPVFGPVRHDGGTDTLSFGAGIGVSDISIWISNSGKNFNVGVKHAGSLNEQTWQITDVITVLNWDNQFNRIETLSFADGAVLNIAGTPMTVPFGAALSGGAVAERSASGTMVGTVKGFDFAPNAVLTYAWGGSVTGAFAIDAATGVITVANGALLNYDVATSQSTYVQIADQGGHAFYKQITINVIDVPNQAPVLSVPASNISASAGQSVQVSSLFSAADADSYPDLMRVFGPNPQGGFDHYVSSGFAEGRATSFDPLQYLASNADLLRKRAHPNRRPLPRASLHRADGRLFEADCSLRLH
jgi:hypothetical protein